MADSYIQGGGGGKAPTGSTNDSYAFAQPYDVAGEPSAEKMAQINEMMEMLFKNLKTTSDNVDAVAATAGGTGDVAGPSSAVSNDVALFDGVTGKLIKDSGISSSDIGDVTGPAGSTDTHVVLFDGSTGKLIKDSGQTVAQIQAGASGNVTLTTFDIISKATYMALNSSPLAIGVNNDILGWSMDFTINLNGGTAFSSGPTLNLRRTGDAVNITPGFTVSNPGSGSRYSYFNFQPAGGTSQSNDFSTVGANIVIRASTDLTGGSAATVHFRFNVYSASRTPIQ